MIDQDEKRSGWGDVFGEELPYEENPEPTQPAPPPPPPPAPIFGSPDKSPRGPISQYQKQAGFSFVGRPVYNIKWDDLGLGLMKPMGYAPNRAIRIEVTEGKWIITGARVPSSILLVLVLGAGGAFHFLQNILSEIKNWGEVLGAIAVFLPTLLNLIIRNHSLELYPFELDFLGYDPNTHVLVLSTVTEPAGVLAMRIDFPSDDALQKVQEAKLIDSLRHSHTGFMLIQGDANIEEAPPIKQWSLWTLVWLLIWGIVAYFYFHSKPHFH